MGSFPETALRIDLTIPSSPPIDRGGWDRCSETAGGSSTSGRLAGRKPRSSERAHIRAARDELHAPDLAVGGLRLQRLEDAARLLPVTPEEDGRAGA
jgi:hypothetical protein